VDQGEAPHSRLSAHQYHSFVVRVLTRTQSGRIVHGDVTHLANHDQLRFTDPRRILPFILAQLGLAARGGTGRLPPTSADDA
jgi:hypothetical protein